MKHALKLMIVAAALTASPAALAQGGYIGLAIGQSKHHDAEDVCTAVAGLPGVSCEVDDTDTAGALFGGYEFNRYFGVEIGYHDFGEAVIDARIPGPLGEGRIRGTVSVSGAYAALVGRAPIGDRFSLLGKIGVLSGTAESDVTLTVRGVPLNAESFEDDGSEGIYGLGFAYRFNDRFGVRLMYDRLGTDSGLDTVSLGFVGRF